MTASQPPAIPSSSSSRPLCHYIVIRDDLPRGVLAAQVAHAAGESAQGALPDGTIVVVLAVPDEARLLEIRRLLALAQLDHRLVVENAGPYADQAMSIGLKPSRDRAAIGKVVSSLPLLK